MLMSSQRQVVYCVYCSSHIWLSGKVTKRNVRRLASLVGISEEHDSDKCEELRDDAHHVGYIRQLWAHANSPSVKEMVAGAQAMQV